MTDNGQLHDSTDPSEHVFTDVHGNRYLVRITVGDCGRILEATGVDFLSPEQHIDRLNALYMTRGSLLAVARVVCRNRIHELGLTPEEWLEGLGPLQLVLLIAAVRGAIRFFICQLLPEMGTVFAAMDQTTQALLRENVKKVGEWMQSPEVREKAREAMDQSLASVTETMTGNMNALNSVSANESSEPRPSLA